MTLLRYRVLFDCSYLTGQGVDEESLTRLVYAAIEPQQRPEFEDFARAAAADRLFPMAALKLRNQLMRPDGASADGSSACPPPEEEYEYALLSLFASQGFDRALLSEVTMAQAVSIIKVSLALRNPAARPRAMDAAQRKKLYGITPDKEARVAEALKERSDG